MNMALADTVIHGLTTIAEQKASDKTATIKRIRKDFFYTDFTAESTSDTEDFDVELPDGAMIMGISHKLVTKFDAPDASDAVFDLGDGSNADRFIDARDVHDSGTTTFIAETADEVGDGADAGGLPLSLSSATTLRGTLTLTGDNCSDLTAGHIIVWVDYYVPEDPTA